MLFGSQSPSSSLHTSNLVCWPQRDENHAPSKMTTEVNFACQRAEHIFLRSFHVTVDDSCLDTLHPQQLLEELLHHVQALLCHFKVWDVFVPFTLGWQRSAEVAGRSVHVAFEFRQHWELHDLAKAGLRAEVKDFGISFCRLDTLPLSQAVARYGAGVLRQVQSNGLVCYTNPRAEPSRQRERTQ